MEEASDVEATVIGHGEVEGPFTEIDGLEIERDPDFPICVTVQFYKATSNGVISAVDGEAIAAQIQRVHDEADYVGSLVVDGPSHRPTEYDGSKAEPDDWWRVFWRRFEENTGLDREGAHRLWRRLGFRAWPWPRPFRPSPSSRGKSRRIPSSRRREGTHPHGTFPDLRVGSSSRLIW